MTAETKVGSREWAATKMIDMRGNDYLPVPPRIVMMRTDHPDWAIMTEPVPVDNPTMFRAVIADGAGNVIAIGHKSVTDFRQGGKSFAFEKAETGAIGRALAFAGYGTMEAQQDITEGDEIADSPQGRVNGTNYQLIVDECAQIAWAIYNALTHDSLREIRERMMTFAPQGTVTGDTLRSMYKGQWEALETANDLVIVPNPDDEPEPGPPTEPTPPAPDNDETSLLDDAALVISDPPALVPMVELAVYIQEARTKADLRRLSPQINAHPASSKDGKALRKAFNDRSKELSGNGSA